MKAQDLKPFETPTSLTVTTVSLGGVSGYGATAYSVRSRKVHECSVISCKWQEGVVMGSKMLMANIAYNLNGKKCFGDVRFFDEGNGYVQNRNSVSMNLR